MTEDDDPRQGDEHGFRRFVGTIDMPLAGAAIETAQGQAPTTPRPPLPNEKQLASYTYATLQKAVTLLDRDDSTNAEIASAAKLSSPDVRRVRAMWKLELFRLSSVRKLLVNDRVGQTQSRYVLRYLSEDGEAWLDPLRGR